MFLLPALVFATEPATTVDEMDKAYDLASQAEAPVYAEKVWSKGEKLRDRALKAGAEGKTDKAREYAAEASQYFAEAELLAIQTRTLQGARDAIEQARGSKAHKYAPRTLQRAESLAAETEKLLGADRYAAAQAAALAEKAAATARHAEQITALARKKPKTEDLLLQWEGYVYRLQTAAAMPAPVDTAPEETVSALEAEVGRLRHSEKELRENLAASQAFNTALEDEIRELDIELGGASSEREELVMRLEAQARAKEQLSQAEALFSRDEALVFRQSNNVVVRLIGLRFASGSAELDPGNEQLLEKVEQAIALYPGSLLLVEGHTDSSGSDRINKRLSEQRAQTVADHMISEMRIPASRLMSVGYGAERPIANNDTKEGREKNRRIDLLITPQEGIPF